MPIKKKNEAAGASTLESPVSVPVTKKPRTKAAASSAVEKTAKATAPRRKATPKTKVADSPNVSIANLSDAIETQQQIDARTIAELAYQSWLERGCPMGSPQEDWYRAERELIAKVATAGK
jgi:hypothetical protein